MNKQIEKLLGQALDSEVPETWTTLTPEQFTKVSEKFTELIVQECVNVLHDNELWNRHISHALKEHFGVEQ